MNPTRPCIRTEMDDDTPRARLYYLFGNRQEPDGSPWLATISPALFGIAVGLLALAGAWRRAATFGWELAAAVAPIPLWLGAVVGAAALVLYALKWRAHPRSVAREFLHPVHGPLLVQAPLAVLLAVIELGDPRAGIWLVVAVVAIIAGLVPAARLLGLLANARFPENAATPVLYLPLTALPLTAAMALAALDCRHAAMPLFGAGLAGWLLLETRVMPRLFQHPMPATVRASMGSELLPPVLAALAAAAVWPALPAEALLAGLGAALLPLATLLLRYGSWGELRFSLAFWSFAFPLAVTASIALDSAYRGGWPLWPGVALLAFASTIIAGLGVRSVALLLPPPPRSD